MELGSIKHIMKTFRRRLSLIIFGIFIAWPVFHIFLVKNTGMSSWRLFGWGMYATPNPEAQSRLRVLIRDPSKTPSLDTAGLYSTLGKLNSRQALESLCINLFIEEPGENLKKLPGKGLCRNNHVARELDYFIHFNSSRHLKEFIVEALFREGYKRPEAYAFLTHQRFNLFQRTAYLESDIYKVSGEAVQYLGKIKNEGGIGEGQAF